MPRRESHLHGLLLVDKPGLQQVAAQTDTPSLSRKEHPSSDSVVNADGAALPRLYTSHDIVQLVRRWSGQRRIGHTGTLDPMAGGLMVLCLGQATRLVEYYQGHDKIYLATITLGEATDTYDAVGKIVATAPIPALTHATVEDALQRFRGEIQQIPPIYSALKQGGESLHRKARRGEEVTVAARPVTIYAINLIEFAPPATITLRIHCSAGTYIRSLAHDFGVALGSCAHLSMLRREAIGDFHLDQALTLQAIEAAAAAEQLDSQLIPAGTALRLPTVRLTTDDATRLGHGQQVLLPIAGNEAFGLLHNDPPLAKAVDTADQFLGIIRCLQQPSIALPGENGSFLWKAEKWLATA